MTRVTSLMLLVFFVLSVPKLALASYCTSKLLVTCTPEVGNFVKNRFQRSVTGITFADEVTGDMTFYCQLPEPQQSRSFFSGVQSQWHLILWGRDPDGSGFDYNVSTVLIQIPKPSGRPKILGEVYSSRENSTATLGMDREYFSSIEEGGIDFSTNSYLAVVKLSRRIDNNFVRATSVSLCSGKYPR